MQLLCGDALCSRTSQCNGSSDRPGVGKGGSETRTAHAVEFWPCRSSELVSYADAGTCNPTVVSCYAKADELQLLPASISSGKCNVCVLPCCGEHFVVRTIITGIIRAGDVMWDWKFVCEMHTRFMAGNVEEFRHWLGALYYKGSWRTWLWGCKWTWTAQYNIGECEWVSCALKWAVSLVKCYQIARLCLLRECVCVCVCIDILNEVIRWLCLQFISMNKILGGSLTFWHRNYFF